MWRWNIGDELCFAIVSPVWFRHVQSVSLRPWAWITVKSTGCFNPKGNDSFISWVVKPIIHHPQNHHPWTPYFAPALPVVLAASQEAGAPAAPAAKEKHNPNRLADSQKKLQTCARALRNRMVRTEGEVVMMMMRMMMMMVMVMLVMLVMVDILVISCVNLRLSRQNNHSSTTYIITPNI